ncbi:hlyD secretion family 6 domain protein [Paraburkholderia xenovorans LB400]|nr:hlyD secretion family 6 domain protein [Paraburkholderia xenovorans LB400]
MQIGLPEVRDHEPFIVVDQREQCLRRCNDLPGQHAEPDDAPAVRRAYGRVAERVLRDVERRLPRAHRCLGAGFRVDCLDGCRLLFASLLERGGRIVLRGLRLIELLGRHVAFRRQRPKPLHRALRKGEIGLGPLHLIRGDGRGGSLGRQHPPLGIQCRLRYAQVRLSLRHGQTIRNRVDLKQQIAFCDVHVLGHRNSHDAAADHGGHVDDIGVDRGVVGGRHHRTPVQHIECEEYGGGDDCKRNQLGPERATMAARSPHGPCPNQSTHTSRPAQTPIAVQTKS